MGKLDDATDRVAAATTDVADVVDELRRTIDERLPIPVYEPRGYVSTPSRPRALTLGLRLCLDVDSGTNLADKLRPVPAEYLENDDGRVTVTCVCGARHLRAELVECPGACGRWFVGDGSGVWAVRLEHQEPYERPMSVPRPAA